MSPIWLTEKERRSLFGLEVHDLSRGDLVRMAQALADERDSKAARILALEASLRSARETIEAVHHALGQRRCAECGGPVDFEGYCDPCATAASAKQGPVAVGLRRREEP
jgi:hypothetical protein